MAEQKQEWTKMEWGALASRTDFDDTVAVSNLLAMGAPPTQIYKIVPSYCGPERFGDNDPGIRVDISFTGDYDRFKTSPIVNYPIKGSVYTSGDAAGKSTTPAASRATLDLICCIGRKKDGSFAAEEEVKALIKQHGLDKVAATLLAPDRIDSGYILYVNETDKLNDAVIKFLPSADSEYRAKLQAKVDADLVGDHSFVRGQIRGKVEGQYKSVMGSGSSGNSGATTHTNSAKTSPPDDPASNAEIMF